MLRLFSKTVFIFFTVSSLTCTVSFAASPIDIQRHWAFNEINTLLENQIISGYPNERLKPDQNVTMQELAVMLYKLAEWKNKPLDSAETQYSDEAAQWAKPAIDWSISNNIILPDSDNSFNEKKEVDRAMLAKCIYNYLIFEGCVFSDDPSFLLEDIEYSDAKNEITRLCSKGIISGYPDNTYRPDNLVTRAEIFVILQRISETEIILGEKNLPEYNVIDVPYYSQVYPVSAPVGCEGTSLLMGLKAKGYAQDIELKEFLENMPRHTSNPAKGFVGSPFIVDTKKLTRTTIYPAKLAEYGNLYGNTENLSGASPTELQAEVLAGNPVVAYVTMWWEKPFYREYDIEGQNQRLLSNNHVILVCGYDGINDMYYIADPYNKNDLNNEYRYWIDGYTFEHLYKERYHAVVVK